MKKVFLMYFVPLLIGMIGSVSCNDSEAEIELGVAPPAPVPQTGQTTCWDTNGEIIPCGGTGQDGDVQAGVMLPSPRFTDNGDGTITDNLTGLIWLKDANCLNGAVNWAVALTFANTLNDGECGLSDGSMEGGWYLPNVRELFSLIDFQNSFPSLPAGHPFMNFQSSEYWSSTTLANFPSEVHIVNFIIGGVSNTFKDANFPFVIPVRGGL